MDLPPFDPLIGRIHEVLDLRERQHALSASNLANVDTPGYRAKYLDFGRMLPSVVKGDLQVSEDEVIAHVEEYEPPGWSVDRSSVMPEREIPRMKNNMVMYSALTRGLSKRLALLKYAAGNGR